MVWEFTVFITHFNLIYVVDSSFVCGISQSTSKIIVYHKTGNKHAHLLPFPFRMLIIEYIFSAELGIVDRQLPAFLGGEGWHGSF